MCGIGGVMTADGQPPDPLVLDRLTTALAHRGPDGKGRLIEGDVGLVHTRLAIIDLETGGQPLHSANGSANARTSLIANAEIYNHVELRAAMADVPFATGSDCEPPLHLYRQQGVGFAGALRGMYAIAIHDPARGRLVLARDPFGIKPLYYAETAAGFAFASEPRALMAAEIVTPRLNSGSRDELLQLRFTTGAETAFEGIRRLLPGETVEVAAGRVVARHRHDALPEGNEETTESEEAIARLGTVFAESVEMHQRSDVPYAMFLSGGIDSTAVLAMMARLNDQPVRAYTAGFEGTAVHDERQQARKVASDLGAEHVEVSVTEDDFWRQLPAIAWALDDPTADYAALPSFMLARRAQADGLKVILTGEGGDELFAGYGRYRTALRPRWLGGRPLRARGAFDGLGVLRDGGNWRLGMQTATQAAARPGRSRLQEAQATDCADWLPNDLLTKLDRCLMAHGVEGRVPFLDPAVAAFAFPLADRLKIRDGRGKWILRRWLQSVLPKTRAFQRKRGFTVPVGDWISRQGSRLGPLVARQPGVAEACLPDRAAALFQSTGRRPAQAAWILLFFALWHQVHIVGVPADGDVFHVLSQSS